MMTEALKILFKLLNPLAAFSNNPRRQWAYLYDVTDCYFRGNFQRSRKSRAAAEKLGSLPLPA
jgi:hypothetical protein